MSDKDPLIFDSVNTIVGQAGEAAIKRQQVIPQSYLDSLKREKDDSITMPSGETLYRVASVPAVICDKWAREGFDYMRAPIRDVLKKLAQEQLDAFITTRKRI